MDKAVKFFLFFLDFVVRYVRFWSRLFTYFNAPLENRRHVSNGVNGFNGFIATKRRKMHKRDKKMTKKVLFLFIGLNH